jgi:hypothetical protein
MFAPLVVALRNWLGSKTLNRLRGQAIARHSQVITAFCNRFGIQSSYRQSLIRMARDNGKQLGLLA